MSSSAPATPLHQKGATPEEIGKYEPVIGLEVHVQLNTRTKIFCGCPTGFGAPPNSNVCSVCLGLPGALPMLNRRVVEMAIQAALATHCKVNRFPASRAKIIFIPIFLRATRSRNTISRWPSTAGWKRWTAGKKKRIGITRIHLEDDAGKSIHDGFKDSERFTYVDLNRSGTPLIEIVSEPDIRSLRRSSRISHRAEADHAICGRVGVRHGEGPTALRCECVRAAERRGEIWH